MDHTSTSPEGTDVVTRPVHSGRAERPSRPAKRRASPMRARNVRLEVRCRIQAAAMSMLGDIAELTAGLGDSERAVRQAFVKCMAACGVHGGALFLLGPDGSQHLAARYGLGAEEDATVATCFGDPALPRRALYSSAPIVLRRRADPRRDVHPVLLKCGADLAVLASFSSVARPCGVVMIVVKGSAIEQREMVAAAGAIAAQLGRAVTLARTCASLTASEQRYRLLMERANEAVFMLSTSGEIRECNRRAEEAVGLPQRQIVGLHFTALLAHGARAWAEAGMARMLREGSVCDVMPILRGDGTTARVQLSASVIDVAGEPVVLAFARDVTVQARLDEQARHVQKMEALGQLAGGVAHDFNNLMVAVLVNADLLLEDMAEDDPRRLDIIEMRTAGERATALTRQLLAFSRRQVLEPGLVGLNDVVLRIHTMMRRVLRGDIEILTKLPPEVGQVRVDRGQIEQVIINLAVNARDAMPRGGRLTLATSEIDVTPAHPVVDEGLKPGRYLVLTVSDTGCGMSEAVRSRVFEPFFTTKPRGQGTGLGLSTSYGIARQSHGTLRVVSEPGRGASFELYLPWAAGHPLAEAASRAEGAWAGTETLLLLEDDPDVRQASRRVLAGRGYHVIEASSAEEAMYAANAWSGEIQLLITDIVLPGMGGVEAGAQLRARRPGLRTVYMSGFSEDAIHRGGRLERGSHFLQKPFTPDQLGRAVRDALDAGART